MPKLSAIGSIFCVLFFFSCGEIVDPSLERIEQVTIKEMSQKALDFDAVMIIKNPNSFALDLSQADLVAYVDDIELATISQGYEAEMPANDEFEMPINIKMDLEKLYSENPLAAIGKGLQIMSQKKVEVRFKGTIKAGKGAAKINVDIDQLEEVKW